MSSSSTDIPAAPPDVLEDNVKRWIVVDICLHNFVSPTLRTYINDELLKRYQSLVTSHDIDKQTYKNHHSTLPISNVGLNYGTINNNKDLFGNKKEKYDYEVKNSVDLSKLFLQPFQANYTAFDSKCDSSALLGLIEKINTFHPDVRTDAKKIRDSVRNETAHPDFEKWDSAKYADSFSLLKHLMTSLALDPAVTNTIMGNLNIWEGNGINYLSGTPLGLDLYRHSIDVWQNEKFKNDEKICILKSHFEDLKSDFYTFTEKCKTDLENLEKKSIVTERLEYELKDFPRADELQTIFKESLDLIGKETCIPSKLHDLKEQRPQAIFCYQQGTKEVDFNHFSVNKLGTSVKKTESTWTFDPLTTVCILEGTSEGKLTNPDILVLKALLDLPREYMENALFVVRGFSYEDEHLSRQVLYDISDEISSVLNLTADVNTVYTRLYPYDHQDIASRMSISFQKQMLDRLVKISDDTLKDIMISEKFLTSKQFDDCIHVLSDTNGPLHRSNCGRILHEAVRKYKQDLNEFVLAEFEKTLRLKIRDILSPQLPTHYWADLSKRTHSSMNMLEDDIGDHFSSDFVSFFRKKIELKQDDITNRTVTDCRDTHLKDIRRIKKYLQGTLQEILDNRNQVNQNDSKVYKLQLLIERFDPKCRLSFLKGRFTIRLTDHKRRLKEAQDFLSLFLENLNDIEYVEHTVTNIKNFMGTLTSGDRIFVIGQRHKCTTASFFLRDSVCKYVVSCRHILATGEPCCIEYSTFPMTTIIGLFPILQFDDIDIVVFRIHDPSIICQSGIKSDVNADFYLPLDGHVFSDDMMTLPIGSQVYKWGAGSGLTYGKFVGVSFVTQNQTIGVIIEEDTAHAFAQLGDSGSVICFKTELQKVYAAFVLIGKTEDTHQRFPNISTYACIKVQNVLSHITCSHLQNLKLSFSDSRF